MTTENLKGMLTLILSALVLTSPLFKKVKLINNALKGQSDGIK
jgi:hypothetical protein